MLQYDLTAQVRNSFGKGASRSMRREGMTPAILYGPKIEPLALKLDCKVFTKTLLDMQRRNAVFSLDVTDDRSSQKRHVMVKALQTNPTTDALVHADFLEIPMDQPMVLDVPVNYVGKAKGIELGGELHVTVSKVSLKGIVLDIPDFIELDISNLDIGDRFLCADLDIPANVEMLNDKDSNCVSIVTASKKVLEEDEEEAAGEVSEEAASEGEESA